MKGTALFCSLLALSPWVLASNGRITSNASFFNPASFSDLIVDEDPAFLTDVPHQQLTAEFSYRRPTATFKGTSGTSFDGQNYFKKLTGKSSFTTHRYPFALHYAARVSKKLVLGFRAGSSYITRNEYGRNSVPRYDTFVSNTTGFTYGPDIAYQFMKQFSVGAGLDFQYYKANTMTYIYNPSVGDTFLQNYGDDWGLGWHVGALFKPQLGTEVGLSYFSKIKYRLHGRSIYRYYNPYTQKEELTKTHAHTSSFYLPYTIKAQIFQALNNKFGVFGALDYVGWSGLKKIEIRHAAISDGSGENTLTTNYDYRDIVTYALGAAYFPNKQWLFKFALAFDQSPSKGKYRGPTNTEQHDVTAGAAVRYKITKNFSTELQYSRTFDKTFKIHHVTGTALTDGKLTYGGDQATVIFQYRF